MAFKTVKRTKDHPRVYRWQAIDSDGTVLAFVNQPVNYPTGWEDRITNTAWLVREGPAPKNWHTTLRKIKG